MFVEQIVGQWDVPLVPPSPAASLVARDQQDRHALGVKGEQDANLGSTYRAGAKLLHVANAVKR